MKLLNGIGLGTFPFANPFTKVNENEAFEIVSAFFDKGGKYIDTAPTYAFGEVENLLGRVLKKFNRKDYFINTSCGFVRQNDQYIKSGKYEDVINECEHSLMRLGISELDLYISHTPDTDTGTPFAETIAALENLKKQGKIKAIGVSNVSLNQLIEYNKSNSIDFVQNRFSLLNQCIESDFSNYCLENNIGIVAFQVIERGLLTSKIKKKVIFSEGDLRKKKPEFRNEVLSVIQAWVLNDLVPISIRSNLPLSTLAIKWALSKEFIALCQCGATSVEQVKRNLLSISPNDDKLINEINEAYQNLLRLLRNEYHQTPIEFLGISIKDTLKGSATGK